MNGHISKDAVVGEETCRAWTTLFRQSCNEWFQLALLLCADAELAEASVTAMLEDLDYSHAPDGKEPDRIRYQLVLESLARCRCAPSSSLDLDCTESLLQPGFRPVVKLPVLPRVSFVLRHLLGYRVTVCTSLLNVEEAAISTALQTAFLHLSANTHA